MKWNACVIMLLVQVTAAPQSKKLPSKLQPLTGFGEEQENRRMLPRRRRQACVPLQFDQLMSMYTAQADYNPTYVAATDTEAMLMPNLLWSNKDIQDYEYIIKNISNSFPVRKANPWEALKVRELIALKLNLPLNNLPSITTTKKRIITTNSRFCTESGDMDYKTKEAYLCSSCSVTTSMDKTRFPRYVNEVICKEGASCLRNEGSCKQNTIYVGVLILQPDCQLIEQNGQKIWIEKWSYVRNPIRISCECQVRTDSSIYKNYVKN